MNIRSLWLGYTLLLLKQQHPIELLSSLKCLIYNEIPLTDLSNTFYASLTVLVFFLIKQTWYISTKDKNYLPRYVIFYSANELSVFKQYIYVDNHFCADFNFYPKTLMIICTKMSLITVSLLLLIESTRLDSIKLKSPVNSLSGKLISKVWILFNSYTFFVLS